MKKNVVLSSPAGEIKICSVWDFMRDVRREYCPEFTKEIAAAHRKESELLKYSCAPQLEVGVYSSTTHTLLQNPMKLLTELKRTTSKKEFTRKITLAQVLHEVSNKSMEKYGSPTHLFTVGKDLYALVCSEDVALYVTKDFKQQLICHRPERNFVFKAKKLKIV